MFSRAIYNVKIDHQTGNPTYGFLLDTYCCTFLATQKNSIWGGVQRDVLLGEMAATVLKLENLF